MTPVDGRADGVDRPMTVPYGAWPSPVTAARLVEGSATVREVRVDGDDVWWDEVRPDEGGRTQLVRCRPGDELVDVLPAGWNVRTQVHEYGGGAWAVRAGVLVFSHWDDQRLYRFAVGVDGEPVPISPDPDRPRGLRYADACWFDDGWLICVRESHGVRGEAVNEMVAVPLDGSAVDDPARIRVLVSGHDFVSSPRMSGLLAWTAWDHPRMPWDGTELWVGVVEQDPEGAPTGVAGARRIAGGADESIVQPEWTGDRELLFLSDRSGWWNPWRDADEQPAPVAEVNGEIGGPQWVLGGRWFAPLTDGRLVCSITRQGVTGLCLVDADGRVTELDAPFTSVDQVVADGSGGVIVVAATATTEPAPVRCRFDGGGAVELTALRPPQDVGIGEGWISGPEPISFPSAGVRTAHALYYPPRNPTAEGPDGDKPPLLVLSHGGPTSAARARFDLARLFWTSRGFAVVDVNYGGSTGYGRPYRRLLDGAWGIVDVEDCIAAAGALAERGLVDPERLAIRGGSAGGFTTLAALTFHDTFSAGASHYGVADLEALARETHKFESRYLDGLVGPYPEAIEVYRDRSPVHHTDQLDRPLIVFQGLEDEVVPPNQAEMMVAALAAKGVPHAYVAFEGEQHGFRKAENIIRSLEAELWFYGRVFGFTPADAIAPVETAVGLG